MHSEPTGKIAEFLSAVAKWGATQPDVTGVALVGSYARGSATSSSDIDLVVLTHDPDRYIKHTDWAKAFGHVRREQTEDWGKVTSLRVWYEGGFEVEYGLATPEWATPPLDEGTRRVIEDGMIVLFDRDGLLSSLLCTHLPKPCNPTQTDSRYPIRCKPGWASSGLFRSCGADS
jgi:predicted nucleotidyltransferase